VQKAKLLPMERNSAAFVRPGIIKLNAIRNKFGHQLDYDIEDSELGAISDVLRISRPGMVLASKLVSIEVFTAVACTFLAVTPPHLKQVIEEAFSKYRI